MRKFATRFLTGLIGGSALIACGSGSGTGGNTCAAPLAATATKVQFQSAWRLGSEEPALIPEGTALVAVIRDECGRGPITSSIDGLYPGRTRSGKRSYVWRTPSPLSLDELNAMANDDACVTMITESYVDEATQDATIASLPDDPRVEEQVHLDAIEASQAYDTFFNSTTGIQGDVVIAVVDSGLALDHEDLRAHLWINGDESPGNRIDDDGNGYIDDVNGYNFASDLPSPAYEKTSANGAWQYGHGTKVAGLAAAVADNGKGISGVMGRAKIMALNNMGKDTIMAQADTTNAIRYAVDNGAHVINLSLGSTTPAGTDYKNALTYAAANGVVVLAAAGNDGTTIGTTFSAAGQAPSIPGLISIGNFKASDFTMSSTSNHSTTYVELGAPGTDTQSTGLLTTSAADNSSYSTFSGTSAAVPVASGAAALAIGLVRSRGYEISAGEIENLLLTSATKEETLKKYFKDGNALNIASLAKLIDARYPYQGHIVENIERKPPRVSDGDSSGCP